MRWALGALVAAVSAILLAAPAGASTDQEAMFQDDAALVYPSRAEVGKTLDTLQSLGVDRVRVTVYWRLVAPSADSERKPNFAAGDPAAYPRVNWRRYDDVVRSAYDRGVGVNFDVAGPAPDWASTGNEGFANPSAGEFGQFVHAVAARYTGSYLPPPGNQNPPPPPPANPAPLPPIPPLPPVSGVGAQQQGEVSADSDGILPRVNYWSFMNEPNQKFFLMPQYIDGHEASPRIFRGLVDAGWNALAATGHGGDNIIIGDTAPKGGGERDPDANMRPLRFVRALYCIGTGLRPLLGQAARDVGCPDTAAEARDFPNQHPALFRSAGFAHHPYSLLTPPSIPSRNPDDVGMADLGRLSLTLRRIFAAYRLPGALPLFNTEFGYQSRPPDPFGFPEPLQAAYINQAEFLSYTNRNVRSTHQFLLLDAPPYTQFPPNSFQYWSSFQTGLETHDGGVKQAFAAYRIPIFIPGARRFFAANFRIWGAVRPAPNGSDQTVQVQYMPKARGAKWRTMKSVKTRNSRNYVDTHLRLSHSGAVRLRWRSPSGAVLFSRPAGVKIG